MASKSSGKEDALRNFEEWRKNKVTTEGSQETIPEAVVPEEATLSKAREESAPREPKDSVVRKAGMHIGAFFMKLLGGLSSFGKSVWARIAMLFAAKEKTKDASIPAGTVDAPVTVPPSTTEATPREAKPSAWARMRSFFAGLRAKYSEASPRKKKITVASVIAGAVVVVAIILLAKFEFVTVDAGIETTLGDAKGTTVLIDKGAPVDRNDLIVAVQPGGVEGAESLIIGTVFSFNDETYALYDGEVIWQIPLSELKGKVVFASATQQLP